MIGKPPNKSCKRPRWEHATSSLPTNGFLFVLLIILVVTRKLWIRVTDGVGHVPCAFCTFQQSYLEQDLACISRYHEAQSDFLTGFPPCVYFNRL